MAQRSIALFDYHIVPTNPVGGVHLRVVRDLCHDYDFTVFAVTFENPCPERVRWVRIPAPKRPLALLFVVYFLLAPVYYWLHRLRHRARFDIVQTACNVAFGDVVHSQFCHRTYLKNHWNNARVPGLRGKLRWLDHTLRASLEPLLYRRARRIVVPSRGLSRELIAEFPAVEGKVTIIPNPVDGKRMHMPSDFDRAAFRATLGIGEDDIALVFVALGQFERKGLPLLLDALVMLKNLSVKLVMVGGELDLLAVYRTKMVGMGLSDQVTAVGMQRDVRPYFWAADALAFPSFYEAFSLVTLEAAAAGLPLIVPPINGVEEFIRDGENGISIPHTAAGIAGGIACFAAMPPARRNEMGRCAQKDVGRYAMPAIARLWEVLYESV
ncbi:MAG: glycosyltransferase family 4 protein [Acidobacteriota bacterium]|nr:glycosyltransferase family 4 protein [Acidobacteriota bacterium]